MAKFAELKTKKARIAYLRNQLATNPRWALRALEVIFERQTADEQNSESTVHHNKVGFNGADAEILSSFAKQHLKGRSLSGPQMDILFKRIPKYARQIESVSK